MGMEPLDKVSPCDDDDDVLVLEPHWDPKIG